MGRVEGIKTFSGIPTKTHVKCMNPSCMRYIHTSVVAIINPRRATRRPPLAIYQRLQNYADLKTKFLKRLLSRAANWHGHGPRCVAQHPSISGARAYIRRDQRGMLMLLAHLDMIRLLCVPWRHKKPQRRACMDCRMLSTTVARPYQTPRATSGRRPRVNGTLVF